MLLGGGTCTTEPAAAQQSAKPQPEEVLNCDSPPINEGRVGLLYPKETNHCIIKNVHNKEFVIQSKLFDQACWAIRGL